MKKQFLTFAMLISVAAGAQSTVQIMPISATYTTTSTIQFKVSWTNQSTANHRNKVWIFVDFQPVISPTQTGNWQPATITGTVQKTAGTVSEQSNRGFFLEGTTTNFSSTVTVQLSNTTALYNWCAYGSDYPPNAIDNSSGGYDLKGSPPFIITTSAGTTEVTANTFSGGVITALTDATGCPGALCGKNGEAAGLLNCCVLGTTNCNGTCKTNGTYTTNDGECTGACETAYVQLRNQCGVVINAKYATYSTNQCTTGCTGTCSSCADLCSAWTHAFRDRIGGNPANDFYCQCTNAALNSPLNIPGDIYYWEQGNWKYKMTATANSASSYWEVCK